MIPLAPIAFALVVSGVTALTLREGAERGLRRMVEGTSDRGMVRRAAIAAGGVGLGLVVLGSVFGGGWVAWAVRAVGVGLTATSATAFMVDRELRQTRGPAVDLLIGGYAPGGGSSP